MPLSDDELLEVVHRRAGTIRLRRRLAGAGVAAMAMVVLGAAVLVAGGDEEAQRLRTLDSPTTTTVAGVPASTSTTLTTARGAREFTALGAKEPKAPWRPSPAPARGRGADGQSPDAPDAPPEAVGPAGSYDDAAGDANGTSQTVDPVSQPSFDILRVAWDPVSYEEQGRRGYSTSITIAGPARQDAAYVSYGFFYAAAWGEECQLYHVLKLGTPAYAHGFCGSTDDGTRRFLGRMDGRPVTSAPTAAGGTTLVGTFDDPFVSDVLDGAGRSLYNLSAFTTTCSSQECNRYDDRELDWASSRLSFTV